MTEHCGHRCCPIATNPCHTHLSEPTTCRRCARVAAAAGEATGTDETTAAAFSLGQLVASVITHIVPHIAGLPDDQERLGALVASSSLQVYAEGLIDPNVQALSPREQRMVLAARVGLALAFPHL